MPTVLIRNWKDDPKFGLGFTLIVGRPDRGYYPAAKAPRYTGIYSQVLADALAAGEFENVRSGQYNRADWFYDGHRILSHKIGGSWLGGFPDYCLKDWQDVVVQLEE